MKGFKVILLRVSPSAVAIPLHHQHGIFYAKFKSCIRRRKALSVVKLKYSHQSNKGG